MSADLCKRKGKHVAQTADNPSNFYYPELIPMHLLYLHTPFCTRISQVFHPNSSCGASTREEEHVDNVFNLAPLKNTIRSQQSKP